MKSSLCFFIHSALLAANGRSDKVQFIHLLELYIILKLIMNKCFRAASLSGKKINELNLWWQINEKFDFSKIKYFSFKLNNIMPLFNV